MSLGFTSLILNTVHLQDMRRFYEILGMQFQAAKVDKGSELYKARLGNLEFALYGVHQQHKSVLPALQLSFQITDLDNVIEKLSAVPGALCILSPTDMPDGRKAMVLDPDGNSIEFSEK